MSADSVRLKRARLLVALSTIVLNVGAVLVFANVSWSDWKTGMALNLLDNLILVAYAWTFRDRIMQHLILFGLAMGFTELIADAWLVDSTRTLDYLIGGGPMLWRSPLWMPFAWEVVAVQFAVLGMWLVERCGRTGYLWTALIGAVNIPFYEEMALKTNWWVYRDCRMVLHTPYYIIFGEFLIVLGIVALARRLEPLRAGKTIFLGIIGGLIIFAGYAVAYGIFK